MRLVLSCGLCPMRITLGGAVVRFWWCPSCGCYNTLDPPRPD
jgi:hypothetical protein